jgi:hypothetical protein
MAAKKKAKKTSSARKAKKAPARKAKKSSSKKASKRPAKKTAKRPAKKTGRKATKAAARKAPAKKAKKTAGRKQKTVGEGDYEASRAFLKDQSGFVEKNKANIPAMGRQAEEALDGPEGDSLRGAEATAAARSRDTF